MACVHEYEHEYPSQIIAQTPVNCSSTAEKLNHDDRNIQNGSHTPEVRFVYNDRGERVYKESDENVSFYLNPHYTEKSDDAFKHILIGTTRLVTKEMNSEKPKELEHEQYYYHPDHLGSSAFVTDHEGKLKEHLEYFPFGETWIQEENSLEIAFKFTAKELDSETGLYYFGARYYDPRTSVWASADPILGKYLDGQPAGGVHNARNLSLYAYAHQSPVKLTDPNGMWVNNEDGSFVAEKGDTLSGLQNETGRAWQGSDFKGDPRKLQIGQTVSFAAKNNISNVTVDTTKEAKDHYYNGNGESASMGPNTIQALKQAPAQQMRENRIKNGLTSSFSGSYSVDLTSEVFHVGKTPVDYKSTCGTTSCVTDFSAFVRDGFWDAKDVFNMFTGDGMGPKFEFDGGHPYEYVPHNWTISYPNHYKK